MSTQTIRLPMGLLDDARSCAASSKRTVPQQVAYWAKIGKAAMENPDLPISFVKDILDGLDDVKNGNLLPFSFGE